MPRTITAANTVIYLGATNLFAVPQRLEGFDVDDIFNTDPVNNSETRMGVDGRLSIGWVPMPIVQNFILQADSDANDFFDTLIAAQAAARESYTLFGTILIPSLQKVFAMTKGVLGQNQPISNAKKVMQPRTFQVTWESVVGAPLA